MNIKKTVVNFACRIGDRLKPLLLKILPLETAKKIKGRLIHSAYNGKTTRPPYVAGAYGFGINLIGYIKAQMGLGQGCRLIAAAIEHSEIPFCILDTRVGNPFNHSDESFNKAIVKLPKYSINIFHVNPEQMPPLCLTLPSDCLDRRYNIGIWLWELSEFPDEWCDAFALVDEIWAPSHFNCESIAKKSPVPVKLIPYGIAVTADAAIDRDYFSLPKEKFLFLAMYDSNSTSQRKNPIGVIHAFKEAFPPTRRDVGLVIKINNPTDADLALLEGEFAGYDNISIIKHTLSRGEVNALIAVVDVFVSLHRAEGFGLVIAEAMLLGTPVIATNWSANVDFMNEENSCPVKYELTKLEKDFFFYKAGQYWAEPDESHAAEYMQRLSSDRDFYAQIAENAKAFISENFSVERSSAAIKARIAEIMNRSY